MKIGEKSLGCPVEIEFAVNLNKNKNLHEFCLLQIRPMVIGTSDENINISKVHPQNVVVSDIVYKPLETNFLKHFKNPQKKIYGISMLINQAAPCFKKWFGVMPVIDEGLIEVVKKEINL